MKETRPALFLGISISLGLIIAAWILTSGVIRVKEYERTVTVKGLSEREVTADVAIWPIRIVAASNNLNELYKTLENNELEIQNFLLSAGFQKDEITNTAPLVTDRLAERYGEQNAAMRYIAQQTITIYSEQIDLVRESQRTIADLGKKGVVFSGNEYEQRITYMFTRLNDLKPEMIEEATQNARIAAQQFAGDSGSKLGKLKTASQGQFSITDRDENTPYLKKIRVVSTVQYYLSD